MTQLNPLATSLPATVPFVGPETLERSRRAPFDARLGANESTFGPSPKAQEAIAAAAADAWMYGDPEVHDLRSAIAKYHKVRTGNVIVGEGIDGLLGYLVRLTLTEGDVAVTSAGAYPTFLYHVRGYGARVATVPYKDDREGIDALLDKAQETEAKLIYLANPDNPMGTWHEGSAVQDMIERLPEGTLLVLDEAYADTAPADALPPLDAADPRVIRMRTFSKAHGLAGLRVGYALGPRELIGAFDRVRNHFGLGRVAQAGALAALKDQDYLKATVAKIEASRAEIARIAEANGLSALPSATNFVAVDCGRDGDFARAVLAALVERGIFVRMPGVAPLDRCIRVSCGGPEEMAALEAVLPEALKAAGG